MTPPTGLLAVLIRVITSQEYAVLVALQDGIECADNVGNRSITKVQLVQAIVGAVGVGVLLGHGDELPCVGEGFGELSALSSVAGGVDGHFFDVGGESALFVNDGAGEGGREEGSAGEEGFGEHGEELCVRMCLCVCGDEGLTEDSFLSLKSLYIYIYPRGSRCHGDLSVRLPSLPTPLHVHGRS